MRKKQNALLMVTIMAFMSLSGCFGEEKTEIVEETSGYFEFQDMLDGRTWYHYPGGINAMNNTSALGGDNVPFYATSSYYSIGMSTFEPTMGITSTGNLYITSWGNGNAGSTAIVQCSNMVEMTSITDYTCQDVYGAVPPVANSNDPYVYVDPWTDRIMKFDMHALGGMTVEWSDDEGQSWTGPSIATGYSVQDHQTIASSPYGGLLHETLWVFCINGNYPAPLCSASQDGGFTWGPELPGAPVDCQSGGLSAHKLERRMVTSTAARLAVMEKDTQCIRPRMGQSLGQNTSCQRRNPELQIRGMLKRHKSTQIRKATSTQCGWALTTYPTSHTQLTMQKLGPTQLWSPQVTYREPVSQ